MEPVRMLGLLMLMALLSDVNSTCPGFDGHILDPPEIIGPYGESFYVNCSSNIEVDGMAWKIGDGADDIEDDINFISDVVSLTDWTMTAKCILQLNDTHKCSKDLKITVYQNPEVSVSVQDVSVSAEGTLYKLQCDVMNVAPVQNLTVTWYRNNQSMTMASFNDTTKTPVNVSSDVLVLVTRGENVVRIECKAQLDLGPLGPELPVVSQTNLSAHYAPEFILKHNENNSVVEGDSLTLNCDAEGNPPPVFHWTCDEANFLENTSSLDITYVNTSATYTCNASNHVGYTIKYFSIHVIRETTPEPPSGTERDCPITVMPAEIVVRFGDPVSVNCSTSDTDAFGMGWISTHERTPATNPPSITWSVQKMEEWDLGLSCQVIWPDYDCEKGPAITLYQNPEVSVSVQDVSVSAEGTLYRLQCDVMNVAPVENLTVTWYRNNQSMTMASFNDTTKTPVNVSSDVLVLVTRGENVVQIECKAQLDLGPLGPELPVVSQTNLSAHYAPEFILKYNETISVVEGDGIKLNCDAEGNPNPVFHWTVDGANLLENTSSLDVAHVNTSATYTCTASNHVGYTTKNFSVHVIKQTTPITMPNTEPPTTERDCPITVTPAEIVVRFGDPLSITCSTTDAHVVKIGQTDPLGITEINDPPSITWDVKQMKMWNFNPTCFVNLSDSQCEKRLDVIVYQTPNVSLHHGAMVEGSQHNLICNIYNVAPVQKLRVAWYRDKETVLWETFDHLSSVTPVNVSSILKVIPTRNDNGKVFRCKADLDIRPIVQPKSTHSATSVYYTAVVNYPPEFKDIRENEEVILGKNVTFGCSAEGNPPPEIQWNYTSAVNLKETTVGRQKIINITGATSTNAGVYICVATNEFGRVTRSFTLVVKASTFNWLFFIGFVCAFVFLGIIIIISYKRSKKHGEYHFVPGIADNGTDIPMTQKCGGVKA